tara:strand:- start:184 stop:420 length:237 start_codon:yes stop_codon:yes gene_type:complete
MINIDINDFIPDRFLIPICIFHKMIKKRGDLTTQQRKDIMSKFIDDVCEERLVLDVENNVMINKEKNNEKVNFDELVD